jgi:two-component system, chemotaxis family, chemotaxis protein CheY
MSKKVIVVDDSKTVRDQVRGVLEGAGYQVIEAADGQEGMNQIRDNPDLCMAICDVHMPNVSGILMVESLQADGMVPRLPVIMLTTEAQPALIQRAKQAGAKGWIVKPVKAEHLLAAVNKLARTD